MKNYDLITDKCICSRSHLAIPACAAAAVLSLVLAGCGSGSSAECKALMEAGMKEYESEEYDAAVEDLSAAIAACGPTVGQEEIDTLYALANAQYQSGDDHESLITYTKLIKLMPDCVEYYYERGLVYLDNGSTRSAEADFEQVIADEPENYEQAADLYMKLVDADASDLADTLLSKVPEENATADMAKALIAINQGDAQAAYDDLVSAESILGSTNDIMLYKGYCLEELGSYEEAEQIYVDYTVANGKDTKVLNQRAVCLMKQSEYNDAMLLIKEALKMDADENRQTLLWNQIMIYERLGDYSEAKTHLSVYIAAYPDDEEAAYEMEYLADKETVTE